MPRGWGCANGVCKDQPGGGPGATPDAGDMCSPGSGGDAGCAYCSNTFFNPLPVAGSAVGVMPCLSPTTIQVSFTCEAIPD